VSAAEPHVLIVDDDPIVRDVLLRYLARAGLSAEAAFDGPSALSAFEARRPTLVVLDLMLPRIDGIEVFRRIRAIDPQSAVIMLTARGEQTERIAGLESGADDYVAKPFSPREIVARVKTILRRVSGPDDSERQPAAPLRFGSMQIDLLEFMASRPRIAFSRSELLEELWDIAYNGDPSTVTVHVRRLREKIEADPSQPRHLVTVWGAGYRFEP
jgi:two-component system response regulator ResD